MDLQKALSQYLETLDSEVTKSNYAIVLRDFCDKFKRLTDIDTKAVLAYKELLNGKSPQTVSSRLSAIKSFLTYCWENNWIPMDPTIPIKAVPVPRYKNSKNISIDDFKKLLSHIDVKSLAGFRDYLLLRLLFIYGNLPSILDLKIKSALPDIINDDRKTYITMLSQHVPVESLREGYLFFGLEKMDSSQKLSVSGVRKILQKYCVLSGFDAQHFDIMAMRRLRAKQIYEQTKSVNAVQRFCQHKSSTQTKTFLKTIFPGKKKF